MEKCERRVSFRDPAFCAGSRNPCKREMRKYYVYILTSPTGTLYVGMTNDLKRRIYQHKQKLIDGFTQKYNITRLAYFEETTDVNAAIQREKEIKGWRRSKKISLVKSMNPTWKDLAEDWFDDGET